MPSTILVRYLLLSLVPLIFARGAIFIANIISAKQLDELEFAKLSAIYLCCIMLATPVIATFTQFVSIIGGHLKQLYTYSLLSSLVSAFLTVCFYSAFISTGFEVYSIVFVFALSFIIVFSGTVNAILIGAGQAEQLNISSLVGIIVFILCSFYLFSQKVNWFAFSIIYIALPASSLVVTPLIIKFKSIDSMLVNSKDEQDWKVLSQLFFITVLGAPIQLIMVALLNHLDASGQQVSKLNIAYQWHMLVIIIPTMIATLLMKFMSTKQIEATLFYQKLSYVTAITMIGAIMLVSPWAEGLYGKNGAGIAQVIIFYSIAGGVSVIYHVELNKLLSKKRFKEAIKVVFINSATYVGTSYFILNLSATASNLSMTMSFGYVVSFFYCMKLTRELK